MANIVQTGEIYYRDEEGKLHLAVSYRDEDTDEVWTDDKIIEEDAE